MILQGIMVILLLVAFGGTTSADCPVLCECDNPARASCQEQGLLQPPAGYWPDITDLDISTNNISTLSNKSFSGFPHLQILWMYGNPLTILDFGIFEGLNELVYLNAAICPFTTIIPLSSDKVLPKLKTAHLYANKITSLPNNLISNLPMLESLSFFGTPILIPATGPWIPSNSLRHLDLGYAKAGAMTSETFQGLPNLEKLWMENSGLTDISGIFSVLPKLTELLIRRNPIQVIKKGTFSNEQKLQTLGLDGSQLEVLETGAINGILVGELGIQDTPLACECKYESLYWWAQLNGVELKATCEDKAPCQFEKK